MGVAAILTRRPGSSGRRSALRAALALYHQASPRTPLLLVAVSLVALAVIPLFTQDRIGASLSEITEIVDPVRTAVADMQVALAMEAAGTRGYLLTGAEHYAASHRKARLERKRAFQNAATGAIRLSPALEPAVREIGRNLEVADVLLDALYSGRFSREEYMEVLPDQHARFARITSGTAALDRTLRAEAASRGAAIARTQRLGTILMLLSVLLAVAAVGSVARLSARNQYLAEFERSARETIERSQAEAELRRREVDRVTASREQLVRGFSHDLKNPLNAAEGYLFMLQRGTAGPLTRQQAAYVDKSRRSLTGALHLIDDLLAVARDQGGLELRKAPIDLCGIAARVVEDYAAQAHSKGLSITTEFDRNLPIVHADPDRIAQILGNLVSNAIKYTQSGTIAVEVTRRIDERSRDHAVVTIVDTGSGIPRDAREKIFGEFQRLDIMTGAPGSGIGLAISRRMARLLGGDITLESEVGVGSRFTLWLPYEAAEPVGV